MIASRRPSPCAKGFFGHATLRSCFAGSRGYRSSFRILSPQGVGVSTGGNCSSGRRRLVLHSSIPVGLTRGFLWAKNIRRSASPVGENCHILM
jgi:hypothetical protein